MIRKTTILLTLITSGVAAYYAIGGSQVLAASECDFYRPTAKADIEQVYRGELEIEANRLAQLLSAGGSLEGEYRRFERDTLHRYDDPTRDFFLRAIIHLHCEKMDGEIDSSKLVEIYKQLTFSDVTEPDSDETSRSGSVEKSVTSGDCSPVQSNVTGGATITISGSCND